MKKVCIVLLLSVFGIVQIAAIPCGDVNTSGAVDIVDALLIAQYYVSLSPDNFNKEVADVNGSSVIDIVDALLIAQYYVQLIDDLPGCSGTSTDEPTTDPEQTPVVEPALPYVDWLVKYIPEAYPEIKVVKHLEAGGAIVWYQAIWNANADNEFVASWSEIHGPTHSLGAVEGKYEGKALFIATETDKGWADPAIEFTEGVGYYITGYKSATMSNWEVGGITVVQFDGESRDFVEKMIAALKPE